MDRKTQTLKPRYSSLFLVGLIMFLLLPIQASIAQNTFPKLTGRVVDNANMIDAEIKAKLIEKLAALEAKTSRQLVVATIPSLKGRPLEEYANLLFRHWGLGQAGENNGVLMLVAKKDRKIRIEVGYGLEGELTDAIAKLIIENTIVPKFRRQDYSNGILKGTEQIIKVLSGDGAALITRAKRYSKRRKQKQSPPFWPATILGFGLFLFFCRAIFGIFAMVFGKKTGPKRYKWLGIEIQDTSSSGGGSGGGFSGGFSGGGGSSGGGGASGSW